MSEPTPNLPTTTTSSRKRKPRISLAIATAFGLGYLPKAPGTWGSLGGVALSPGLVLVSITSSHNSVDLYIHDVYLVILACDRFTMLFALLIAGVGVWASVSDSELSRHEGSSDRRY